MQTKAQEPSPPKFFSIDHLYLASFLVCRGHEVSGTEVGDNGRIYFQFLDSLQLRSAAAGFLAGEQVDARKFSFTILKLKKYLPKRQ
jgi:hypothetical protein